MITRKSRASLAGIVVASLLAVSPVMTTNAGAQTNVDYEVYIYAGSIDDVEAATAIDHIGDLERETDMDEYREHWDRLGADQEMPDDFYSEDEDLEDDMLLDDLLSEPHLIVVHETDDTNGPIVAIGVIDGEQDEDEGLLIELQEYEGSGYEGRAWFGQDNDDDGDDEHQVVVGIYPVGTVEPLGTTG